MMMSALCQTSMFQFQLTEITVLKTYRSPRYIILTLIQPAFCSYSLICSMLSRKTINTNLIAFRWIRIWMESTIYHTCSEHVDHQSIIPLWYEIIITVINTLQRHIPSNLCFQVHVWSQISVIQLWVSFLCSLHHSQMFLPLCEFSLSQFVHRQKCIHYIHREHSKK